MEPGSTSVTIYGQEYTVRGGEDGEYVRGIAAYVDVARTTSCGPARSASWRIWSRPRAERPSPREVGVTLLRL